MSIQFDMNDKENFFLTTSFKFFLYLKNKVAVDRTSLSYGRSRHKHKLSREVMSKLNLKLGTSAYTILVCTLL